jgi:hypothetical protein
MTNLSLLSALRHSLVPLLLAPVLGCGASADPLPAAFAPEHGAKARLAPSVDDDDDDSIFVSPAGDDDDEGSRDAPVRSFSRAVLIANGRGHRLTLCAGVFTEPLALTNENGADAYTVEGGAACQGNSSGPSIVRTTGMPALKVFAVAGPTRLSNIVFEHPDAASPGESAVAAHVAFVDAITFTDVTLRAGRGMDGLAGTTQLLSPCDLPLDPRLPTHVGLEGLGARVPGRMSTVWTPEPGQDGGILRFARSSRCVEPSVLAGTGGAGGGASIALLAQVTHVTFVRSIAEAHDSGSGGSGGAAQAPACDPLSQKSCEVLDIGGGGGGAGGLSASVLHRQGLFDIDDASKLLFGKGGAGGKGGLGSRWLNGTAGISGLATTMLSADDFPPEEVIGDDDAPSM